MEKKEEKVTEVKQASVDYREKKDNAVFQVQQENQDFLGRRAEMVHPALWV
jgi:hypothetical protein